MPHLSLVGGKWTTFRALGESLSDKILGILGRPRVVSTLGRVIGGGKDYPQGDAARAAWISQNLPGAGERAELLLKRYGTRAAEVWRYVQDGADAPLAAGQLSTRELEWMVQNELIVRLEDVILRRTSLAFTGDVTEEILEEVAEALAPLKGWDRARATREVELTRELLNTRHGLSLVARTRG